MTAKEQTAKAQREFINYFFFGHSKDPTPEEMKANSDHAKAMGWDKLNYEDPETVLNRYGGRTSQN